MAYLDTGTGYEMFEMLSMLQKAIRRGDYEHAGFAANQLKRKFRTAMWNRIFVISAEDCFGVITKELVKLREEDEEKRNDLYVSEAVALLCRARKSRDACYFSCNFVLASRSPRRLKPSSEMIQRYLVIAKNGNNRNEQEFEQLSLLEDTPKQTADETENQKKSHIGAALALAFEHRDMDMIGYQMDLLRHHSREFLWNVFEYISRHSIANEIKALRKADNIVNGKRSNKDEIFISKAAMLICHSQDSKFKTVLSVDFMICDQQIDWKRFQVKSITQCELTNGKIPDWVYDCHTFKGKKMGKTDWDMTVTEQAALCPLQYAYFDEASWLYTYEQDLENGDMTKVQMEPIWEFAKNHEVNPVDFIPYMKEEIIS